MKTIKINGNTIVFDDRIDEMLYGNFVKYNIELMLEAGIGSDIDALDQRIGEIARASQQKDHDKVIKVLSNLRQAYTFIIQGISPEMNAFIYMIRSINGQAVGELTDDRVKEIGQILSKQGMTVGKLRYLLSHIKESIEQQFEILLPSWVDGSAQKYYSLLRKRVKLILDNMQGADNLEAIDKVENEMLSLGKVRTYAGPKAVQVLAFKNYNDTALIVKQKGLGEIDKMTVVEAFQALTILKEQTKSSKK